jgi:hypothetical protein
LATSVHGPVKDRLMEQILAEMGDVLSREGVEGGQFEGCAGPGPGAVATTWLNWSISVESSLQSPLCLVSVRPGEKTEF